MKKDLPEADKVQNMSPLQRIRFAFSEIPIISEEWTRIEELLETAEGVRLKTICFIPRNVEAPFPTVVQRSCYPETKEFLECLGVEYARRGFSYVYQWCRGTGESEGTWEPNIHEREDGISLMNWLEEKDWVESIGYQGHSYLALAGWVMADVVPQKVKTMFLTAYGTMRHTSAWKDGSFRQDILTAWAMQNAGHKVDADYLESAVFRPQEEVDEKLWGCHLQWYRDWISHPEREDPYWQEGFWGMLKEIPGKMKIPVFVEEGWYDHHLGSALESWKALSKEAKKHSVLQICPGNHVFDPVIFGHPNAEHAAILQERQAVEWFMQILCQKQMPRPEVRAYMIGADEWRSYTGDPFSEGKQQIMYLNGDMLQEVPGEDGKREYIYDPENPIMSHGAESLFNSKEHIGSQEQPEPNWRDDVLSFVSEPILQQMEINGKITVRLYVQSDAPDTCFTVKIMETFSDGRTFHIRNGITTLARNGEKVRKYDGLVMAVDIETWPIAWRIQSGSRLRLDISSSNFPEYSIHPNTDVLWSKAVEVQKARQTIWFGSSWPSCIMLPEGR